MGALEKSIADAENKIAELEASIETQAAEKKQLDEDLKQAKEGKHLSPTRLAWRGSYFLYKGIRSGDPAERFPRQRPAGSPSLSGLVPHCL